jgi:hypothetical protein
LILRCRERLVMTTGKPFTLASSFTLLILIRVQRPGKKRGNTPI